MDITASNFTTCNMLISPVDFLVSKFHLVCGRGVAQLHINEKENIVFSGLAVRNFYSDLPHP
jgi:hypothetical protein